MSGERQVAVRDLVEEGKKRAVILVICAVGLSYLMSLTSSSVLVNLPVAATLIIILRYISLDFEMRRRAAVYSNVQPSDKSLSKKKAPLGPQVAAGKSDWRRKVDSPVVEDAIDHFARHLISEWVTNLWYSRLTPDKEGPEELVQIINSVLGEISYRARSINLIDLLTRDIIHLLCTHLELFRASQIKIDRKHLGSLTIEQRDVELKHILAVENKLHPALFSAEAEHKVLQHLMDGLISFTFKPEDLQCSFFRFIARELLACAVIRPVLNLANPRFINERIESVVISVNKTGKGSITIQETSQAKTPSKTSSDQSSGVELVQLKNNQSQTVAGNSTIGNHNGRYVVKDPLLSVDARSTCSWGSLPPDLSTVDGSNNGIQRHRSGGEWGDMLDIISHRKTQALAPENFENMWAKGRNFKKKESVAEQVNQRSALGSSETLDLSKLLSMPKESDITNISSPDRSILLSGAKDLPTGHKDINIPASCSVTHTENDRPDLMALEDAELESSSSHSAEEEDDDDEEEEISNVTGLDSPGTKVWDGRKNRNDSVSHIRHPLESSDGNRAKKAGKGHAPRQRLSRVLSNRKRLRSDSEKVHVWQELRRTSFSSGDGQDILTSLMGQTVAEDSSDESELERLGRSCSGASASSSAPISLPQSHGLAVDSAQNSLLADSFFRLKCEVVGANVVKSGSKTFAVYSISVTDVNKNIWSIKRRFRHFEELHRRLKEYPLYNLHLPPKHFLSTGLDVPVIQERCKLLDIYLKSLLQIPTISGIIEVWDFLSVDSQTYMFSNSISIIETLSVDLDDKPPEKPIKNSNSIGPVVNPIYHSRGSGMKESPAQMKPNSVIDESRCVRKNIAHSLAKQPGYESRKQLEDSGSDSETRAQRAVSPVTARRFGKTAKGTDNEGSHVMLHDTVIDPTLPTESPLQCVPPNLSAPILDLVDVIFQLQDGGWIRRKVFWVAKQVLQLGMGDAFDDWLIDKIQCLRKGPVIASGIGRIEQILWPDGIFITKHPKRQRPSPGISSQNESHGQHPMPTSSSPKRENLQKQNGEESFLSFDEQQIREANRRAKFVYDLMIENAPAAIVGVIGRKEYEQCAKDLYFFLQSSVCLKQLAFDLLELLLVSTFPELDGVFAQLNHERQKFGAFKPS